MIKEIRKREIKNAIVTYTNIAECGEEETMILQFIDNKGILINEVDIEDIFEDYMDMPLNITISKVNKK